MELTQQEKNIYNCFLKHFRKGLPYQPRKDFSDITPIILTNLKKLSYFFSKFPHITYDDFFGAPNILHPDEKCPPLSFFTTRPAIRAYSLSFKKKQDESPENQLDNIKDGFHFIGMFCLKNKITIDQYLSHKTLNMPTWMQHYREHNINPYCLMELGDLDIFRDGDEEALSIWCGDFYEKINSFRTRYYNSQKTKKYVKEAIKKINDFLKKQVANN